MADITSWTFPSAFTDPINGWDNDTNIYAQDSSFITTTSSVDASTYSPWFHARNFGFSIPAGSTILGVSVRLASHKSGAFIGNATMKIQQMYLRDETGATTGTVHNNATEWTTTNTFYFLGSSSDLWGCALTPEWINDADFGVAWRNYNSGSKDAYCNHDSVSIQVTYQLPSGIIITVWG